MTHIDVFPSADGVPSGTLGSAEDSLVWKIGSQSYSELNDGEVYLEIINQIDMNILETDVVEFKVKFIPDEAIGANVTLQKDMFVCTAQADVNASGYWATSVVDYNVRDDTVAEDSNAAELNLGQDWFIPAQDVDMVQHLCTAASTDSGFACTRLLCIARRKAVTSDTDDFGFSTVGQGATGGTDVMRIPVGDAQLHINMADETETYKQYISNMAELDLTLGAGAISGLAVSAAAVAMTAAATVF